MNKEYVLFHLEAAKGELEKTLKEIKTDSEYDYGNFVVAMQHLYHHINTAWNARDASTERAEACSEDDFQRWRQFPSDIDMSV